MRAAGASAADRLKIKEAVKGGPEHEEYMEGVGKWVEKFNGSQGGYVLKKGAREGPQHLQREHGRHSVGGGYWVFFGRGSNSRLT